MPITQEQLLEIMPMMPRAKITDYTLYLNLAMAEFGIDNPHRQAAFLAQLAHESGQLRYFEELWGPTKAQQKYEGCKVLGNTEPGDGYRYRGRGPIQLTGRANYRIYGRELGLDLEANPDLAATPEVGFRVAALFWQKHGLNELADRFEFKKITLAINGGLNGYPQRMIYYKRALKTFGITGNEL